MFGFELWKFNSMMLGLALPPLFLRGYCRWLPCVVFVKSGAVGWGYPYYSTIRSLLGCQNSLFLFLRIADRIISLSCVCWYRGGACFPSPRFVGELVGDLRPSLKLFMTPTVFSGSVTENLHVNQGVAHCYPGIGAKPWAQEDSTCADPTFPLLNHVP